jgi:hypothetical protein
MCKLLNWSPTRSARSNTRHTSHMEKLVLASHSCWAPFVIIVRIEPKLYLKLKWGLLFQISCLRCVAMATSSNVAQTSTPVRWWRSGSAPLSKVGFVQLALSCYNISSVMKVQSVVKCHCYLSQKQQTTVMQPAGAKTTQTQHRNTRHNDISLLRPERGNREFL